MTDFRAFDTTVHTAAQKLIDKAVASAATEITALKARIATLEGSSPPAPAPTPTPTPTPVPSTATWPKGNAGIPTGITPTAYTGPTVITVDGTVIDGKTISGTLEIKASNVTVKNCLVKNFIWYGIIQAEGSTNLRVENCDVNGVGSSKTTGVAIRSGTLIGCDIWGMVIAVKLWGAVNMRNNYIHDLAEPSTNPDDRHFDGVRLDAGGNCTIDGNTIIVPDGTASVFVTAQAGDVGNVTINNNLLMSNASYTLYATAENGHTISGITITNNYIDKGIYGFMNLTGSPTMSGNVLWIDGTDPTPAAVQTWKNSN